MANLQTLPDEVLVQIAEQLAFKPGAGREESTHALCSLSRCSRCFHYITRKILYRSIPVYHNRDIVCLTRTLFSRRDLAKDVQSLEVVSFAEERGNYFTEDSEQQFRATIPKNSSTANYVSARKSQKIGWRISERIDIMLQ